MSMASIVYSPFEFNSIYNMQIEQQSTGDSINHSLPTITTTLTTIYFWFLLPAQLMCAISCLSIRTPGKISLRLLR